MDYQALYSMTVDNWTVFSALLGRCNLITEEITHVKLGNVIVVYDRQGRITAVDRQRALYSPKDNLFYVLDATENLEYVIREANLQLAEEVVA